MTSFYQATKDKGQYSQALKQSKLDMIDQHPYYWQGLY
ncbi:MAG: hypothetical protein KAH22_03050 [Thiotrichaceae bacterium]|nr:hypothetical protein [Thiotrichaceae bacterium]